MNPRAKICCLRSVEDAALAIRNAAAALSLVSAKPSEPVVIAEEYHQQKGFTATPT